MVIFEFHSTVLDVYFILWFSGCSRHFVKGRSTLLLPQVGPISRVVCLRWWWGGHQLAGSANQWAHPGAGTAKTQFSVCLSHLERWPNFL